MTPRRALVTGGAGFIGSHLVERLIAAGWQVRVLDDLSSGVLENLSEAEATGALEFVHGSVLEGEDCERAVQGCQRVFHLAVQCVRTSLGKPLENHDINATGTLNVLEAARQGAVQRFIYCSSSEVYGNASDGLLSEESVICEPVTVYGAAKLSGELYAKAYFRTYGMPTLVVRPFNAYGPREHDRGDLAEVIPRFVIRALNGLPPIVFGSGENGRDFTYVTEVARGLALAGDAEDRIGVEINIARGEMITVEQVARDVCRLCKRPDLTPEHIEQRPGDVFRLHADTRRARQWLGYEAEIGFEDGLQRYIDWFVDRYPDPASLLETEARNWTLPV